MERRYEDSPYYGKYQPSPFFTPGSQKTPEDELVARSKEWMSRQDKDHWRRSVDDFLDDKSTRERYHKRGDRSRSRDKDRERDRDRDRKEKKSREKSRDRERYSDDEERENRRSRHDKDKKSSEKKDYDGRSKNKKDRDWSSSSRYWEEDKEPRRKKDDENTKWSSNESDSDDVDFEKQCAPYADYSLRPEDRFVYKKQTPQKTIIIRGLAQHITEQDIQDDITLCQLVCKDIRLVRRKDTGTSRGFAFVEFNTVTDAMKWIEAKQGELMLKDHFRALLQYSLPKEFSFPRDKYLTDWYCKCQAHNFRRRDTCFKCNLSRKEVETESMDKVSSHPTNTVLLRGLDALTTEENVLQSIQKISSLPIRSVRIGRDVTTNASRGVCYLEMNSVVDAMYLYNALQSTTAIIDNKLALVSYAKLDPVSLHSSATVSGQIANAAVAAAQWTHQKSDTNCQYSLNDVPRLAEYSASLYATTPQEKAAYLTYYTDYYKKQISQGERISLPMNTTNGLACAQAALSAHKKLKDGPLSEAPDGTGEKTYPLPDVNSYQYDKSSGYYYDPFTTLYYDANSQYYYNNKLQKFLYWDLSRQTYLPAPTDQSRPDAKEEEKKKEKDNEKDKVKVAKRIAKDMERWAKTLNQKKEIAKQNIVTQATAISNMKAAGAADIGYAVLERKDLAIANGSEKPKESLVANYGQGSDSEEEDESAQEDKLHTDWSKLACLLCKRQFASKDALVKHQQLSDLHKQNLSAWYKSKGLDPDDAQTRSIQYRDRARERRMKYGEPDAPQPSKLKETYMKSREANVNYEEPTRSGIGADNLGNKLLQKMGWQEGMGLGKTNQGRTSIIQAERRSATAGLGTKSVGVTPGPGETYKDCVKKMMQIRYSEIEEQS